MGVSTRQQCKCLGLIRKLFTAHKRRGIRGALIGVPEIFVEVNQSTQRNNLEL